MERFAAMVAGRRAAPASADAPAEVEEVKEEKQKKKKGMTKEEEAYLSIQLEEIVIVKNEDIGNPRGCNTQCSASGRASTSPFMTQCASAAAVTPAGSSTAAAARGALTTVARMVGFD